jgi:hypothetical protein
MGRAHLELLFADVRAVASQDARADVRIAASMLLHLQCIGVDGSVRWEGLAGETEARIWMANPYSRCGTD